VHNLTSFVDPQTHSRHFSRTILIKVGTPSSLRISFDSRRVCFAFLIEANWCFFSLFILLDVSGFQAATEINFSELFWQLTKDFRTYNRNLVSQCGLDLITKIHELAITFFANFTFKVLNPSSPRKHHLHVALLSAFELWILTFRKLRQLDMYYQSHTVSYVTLSPTPTSNS